jgi:hypothetical protein
MALREAAALLLAQMPNAQEMNKDLKEEILEVTVITLFIIY